MKRRTFIQTTSAAAAGTALGFRPKLSRSLGSDAVTLGIIGAGSRGQYLMRMFMRLPDVRFGGICDIYEPRHFEGRDITGEETPAFFDYREMLDADLGLDGVIVATPPSMHAEHNIAALDRDFNVYGEKALAISVEDCDAIEAAARRSNGLFQTGLQYRYALWYEDAVRRIREGEIGDVTHIHAYWHRNYNWRRPLPEPGLEKLINWRLYKELSGGLLAELGSHHVDTANWIFDALPERVTGTGGVVFYKDGRETFDNVQVIYSYPGGRQLFFSSIIGNHKQGFQIIVYGTGGTVELTLEDGAFFYEPIRSNSAVPEGEFRGDFRTTDTLATAGDMPYKGEGAPIVLPEGSVGDPGAAACIAFLDSVRNGKEPICDVRTGWKAGVAVALGIEASRTGKIIDFDERLTSSYLYYTES